MEKIVIDFTANPQNINATIDLLEKIGKVDAVNAAQMRNNHEKYMEYSKQKLKVLGDEETAAGKAKKATESNFNSINNSINQLSRELPAFTYSMQTGFMAISNNIPALVDGLNQLKVKNAELAASGKPTQTAFSAITAAIFSWQTALSIGITLLTVYGKEIGNVILNMLDFQSTEDKMTKAINDNSAAIDKNVKKTRELSEQLKIANIEDDVLTGKITKEQGERLKLQAKYSEDIFKIENDRAYRLRKLWLETSKAIDNDGSNLKEVQAIYAKQELELNRSYDDERKVLRELFLKDTDKINDKFKADQKKKDEKNDKKDKADAERKRLDELQALERFWESVNSANQKAFEQDNKERFEDRTEQMALEANEDEFLKALKDVQKKRQDLEIKDSEWQKEFDDKNLKERLKKIAKAEKEINEVISKSVQNQIQSNIDAVDAKMNIQNRAIDQQKILAEQGMQNTLAFEIRRQDELERVRLEEQKKMKKAKELEIFLNALIKYTESEKNPLVAIVKAAGVVGAAKVAEAVYAEEGGVLGSMHSKSYVSMAGATKRHPGGGDVLVHGQIGEGYVSLKDMEGLKEGKLPKWMAGMMRVPFNHKLIPASAVGGSIDMSGIEKKLDSLELTIKNKKETTFAAEFIDNIPHIITKEIENGIARTTRQALTRF